MNFLPHLKGCKNAKKHLLGPNTHHAITISKRFLKGSIHFFFLNQQFTAESNFYCWPEVFSSFCDFMLQSFLKPRHELLQMGELQHFPDILVTEFVKRIQVHAEGAREQHRILRSQSQAGKKRGWL